MLTEEMIKNSLEVKFRKETIKILLIVFVVVFFISFVGCAVNDAPFVIYIIAFLVYLPIFGGCILFEWIGCLLMVKQKDEYVIQEVVFGYPEVSYLAKGYDYFTVAITQKDGEVVYCKTKPMWSDYWGAKNKTWEYSNEKVTVAYNEKRDKLIVLGKYVFKEGEHERDY